MKKRKIIRKLGDVLDREKKVGKLRLGIPQPAKIENNYMPELMSFLDLNPNNIGTTTRMPLSKDSCRELEFLAIKKLGKWLNIKDVDGYFCSGSTEGNIMALWIGREKLKNYGTPIVIAHSRSHYSIEKACNLLNLKLIKSHPSTWNIPLGEKQLKEISKKHKNNPLIIISTIGHTTTGLIDDTSAIANFIKLRSIPSYFHIDAAIGGLILPFVNKPKPFDFKIKEVDSFTTDFHKYGFLYYPAGLFMCRKNLQEKIASYVGYVGMEDDTLCGSRTGILPSLIWAHLEYPGKSYFRNRIKKVLKNKERFIFNLKNKKIPFISEPNMPLISIILRERITKKDEKRFRICPTKIEYGEFKGMISYTIFFFQEFSEFYIDLLNKL